MCWSTGSYHNLSEQSAAEGLADGHLKVWLDGEKLTGGYALTQTKMRGDERNWLLVKVDDEGVDRRRRPTSTQPESVLSRHTNDEL